MSSGSFSPFDWPHPIRVIRNQDGGYEDNTYTAPGTSEVAITGHPAPTSSTGEEQLWKPMGGSTDVVVREGDLKFHTSEVLDANDQVIIYQDAAGNLKRRYSVEGVLHDYGWMAAHLGIERHTYLLREEQHNAST